MSEAQVAANRENAKKGGVKTNQGKTVSRLNAIKHGFFSKIVTEYDKLEHEDFCNAVYEHFAPQNVIDAQLVEILLSNLLAYRRIAFVEQELMRKTLDPTLTRKVTSEEFASFEKYNDKIVVDRQGYEPKIQAGIVETLDAFQRYKTTVTNLILKMKHELERESVARTPQTTDSFDDAQPSE